MLRQRKAHRKSREGCVQCKERHVKCNEVHPQCLNCSRFNLACSFSSLRLTATPLNDDSLADLELLEYWHQHPLTLDHTATAGHSAYNPVRLGFSHHYLLNSILAMAALQLFHEDPSRTQWYARAVAHQQAALARARPHFQCRDGSHHRALLGFSAYTSMYTIAEPLLRPTCGSAEFNPVNELLRAMRLGRCTTAYVRQYLGSYVASDALFVSKFAPLQIDASSRSESEFPQLAKLRDLVQRQYTGKQKTVCLHAAELLFDSIALLIENRRGNDRLNVVFGWGNTVDSAFFDMCSGGHAVALIILAHFAVLLSLVEGFWYLKSWPAALLGHIWNLLKDDWGDILQWPMEFVFQKAPVDLSQAHQGSEPTSKSRAEVAMHNPR